MLPLTRIVFGAVAVFTLCAADQVYRSTVVDDQGQLRIRLASGKEILAPKREGQVSFGDAWISPDSHTVGWLVMYPYPDAEQAWRGPLGGALVLYRAGRVLHIFKADQPIWEWEFKDDGKHIAYREAPMHGSSQTCYLGDVESGRKIATWWNGSVGRQPEWADLCDANEGGADR
ncbi:MAG TPA: hypothetical protein VHU44_00120 [Acidobacteriaceae bacterium]|jgi:hypothetical protein|nr:hypothetical protein [Acidobacteriaceae bacterium]